MGEAEALPELETDQRLVVEDLVSCAEHAIADGRRDLADEYLREAEQLQNES